MQRAAVVDRIVGKAMHLVDRQHAGLQVRQHGPSAFGPEIERQIGLRPCVRHNFVPSRRREDAEPAQRMFYKEISATLRLCDETVSRPLLWIEGC